MLIALEVTEELKEKIDAAATALGARIGIHVSRSALIRMAINQYLASLAVGSTGREEEPNGNANGTWT